MPGNNNHDGNRELLRFVIISHPDYKKTIKKDLIGSQWLLQLATPKLQLPQSVYKWCKSTRQVQKRFSSALDWISKLVLTVPACTADAARGLTGMRQIKLGITKHHGMDTGGGRISLPGSTTPFTAN
jgi:hypothetical protein